MKTIPPEPPGTVFEIPAPIEAREACMPELGALAFKLDVTTAHSGA